MEQAAGDHAYLHMTLTNTCTLPVAVRSPALISDKISLTQLHGELPKVCCSVLLHSRKLLCTKKYFQNHFSYTLYMYSPYHYRRVWRHVELPVVIAKMSWIHVLDMPSCYACAAVPVNSLVDSMSENVAIAHKICTFQEASNFCMTCVDRCLAKLATMHDLAIQPCISCYHLAIIIEYTCITPSRLID